MSDEEQVIRGVPTSPEYLQQLNSLRTLFDPKVAVDRLDAYGKWLFGSSTVIAALGAGLSNTSLSKLRGLGVVSFAVSIVLFGVCLVFASFSVAPHFAEVNLNSQDSLNKALDLQFRSRRRLLTAAAVVFALALLLAALSPLVSLMVKKAPPVVKYSIDEKGEITASVEAYDVVPGTLVEIRLESADKTRTYAVVGATGDDGGHASAQLKSAIAAFSGNVDLVSCVGKRQLSGCEREQRIRVK